MPPFAGGDMSAEGDVLISKKGAIEQLRNPCWLMIGSALGNLVFGMITIT